MVRDVLLEHSGEARTPRSGRFAVPAPPPRIEDWRDAAERRADEKLVGDWWRCSSCGPTQEPVYAGDVAYCPAETCTLRALQVHATINDPETVDRNTRLSGWAGSKSNTAMRARAGLEPAEPEISRALLERPAPRPVPLDDEDLVVDEGSDAAPDVDVPGHEEPPQSEGSDASTEQPALARAGGLPRRVPAGPIRPRSVDASVPANEKESAMPP
ncbi:MAG TPA: hypothetical protein VN716_19100, partial [Vicinamibacterales bacterium]|nr:hypothetical protein [Vicinamibacterales bacterium]